MRVKWSQVRLEPTSEEFFRANQLWLGWCVAVTVSWHDIIWNDIEQPRFGTKLLAGLQVWQQPVYGFNPKRPLNRVWHKLSLASWQWKKEQWQRKHFLFFCLVWIKWKVFHPVKFHLLPINNKCRRYSQSREVGFESTAFCEAFSFDRFLFCAIS